MHQPGTILLEKYRVERVLGKGGMGVVVAARHIQLGELFAIKMLLPESQRQPEALERFLLEARASAKLKGDHVAQVHDIGKLPDGTPYMLMEYLEGEDLGHYIKKRGILPVEEAALYVHQACEAVARAHASGIVHRDLKPSNLFLTHHSNGFPCVKVLDFGIVRELDPANQTGKRLTKTGAFLGSPIYMSPEQMVDVKLTDTRGDVWALGLILYEFVTGIVPFEAEAFTTVVTKVLLTHPDPPSHLNPAVPAEFDAIVMRCLEKQPERRYPTARELMVALEPFVRAIAATSHSVVETSSASIPVSSLAPRMPMAETLADAFGLQSVVSGQTMANPMAIAQAATAATISGNILDGSVMSGASIPPLTSLTTTVLADAPLPPVASEENATPIAELPIAEKPLRDNRDAAKANDPRKKLIWIAIAAAAIVVVGTVAFFSTDATSPTLSASTISSVTASETPPIVAESPSSEPSALQKDSGPTAADVKTTASRASTNAAVSPTKPISTTSPRVTTKKRVCLVMMIDHNLEITRL